MSQHAPTGPALTREDIAAAADRIAGYIRTTPVLHVDGAPFGVACPLDLKLEFLQLTGSFKARGAFNLLLSSEVPPSGVVAASGGNFGSGVAYAAGVLGHPSAIFVPSTSPQTKIDALRVLGADVHVIDGFYEDARAAAEAHRERTGALWAHAYDQPAIVAGAGTVGRELAGQADVDTVLVAVGGGGLIGGVATWFAGDVRVIAVETPGTSALHAALAAGHPVDVEVSGAAASSLGARRVGDLGFAAAQRWVSDALLVSDDAVARAQRLAWEHLRVILEPGGAAALAALTCGVYVPAPDERVAVVLCGANTDPAAG